MLLSSITRNTNRPAKAQGPDKVESLSSLDQKEGDDAQDTQMMGGTGVPLRIFAHFTSIVKRILSTFKNLDFRLHHEPVCWISKVPKYRLLNAEGALDKGFTLRLKDGLNRLAHQFEISNVQGRYFKPSRRVLFF